MGDSIECVSNGTTLKLVSWMRKAPGHVNRDLLVPTRLFSTLRYKTHQIFQMVEKRVYWFFCWPNLRMSNTGHITYRLARL